MIESLRRIIAYHSVVEHSDRFKHSELNHYEDHFVIQPEYRKEEYEEKLNRSLSKMINKIFPTCNKYNIKKLVTYRHSDLETKNYSFNHLLINVNGINFTLCARYREDEDNILVSLYLYFIGTEKGNKVSELRTLNISKAKSLIGKTVSKIEGEELDFKIYFSDGTYLHGKTDD